MITANATSNQAVRHGDRRHAATIARQRRAATVTPREQAKAIAAVIRKRIADGQPVPDLDRYGLTDQTWAELLDLLTADELSAVADACSGEHAEALDGAEGEPSLEEWTAALKENAPLTPEPPAHVPSWRDHEPAIVHSVKWHDEGLEHLHIIRADTLDEALIHIKKLKLCIVAARSKASSAQNPISDSRPDWCHVHNVAMKQRGDESQGYWYSHKAAGTWCRGKAKA